MKPSIHNAFKDYVKLKAIACFIVVKQRNTSGNQGIIAGDPNKHKTVNLLSLVKASPGFT